MKLGPVVVSRALLAIIVAPLTTCCSGFLPNTQCAHSSSQILWRHSSLTTQSWSISPFSSSKQSQGLGSRKDIFDASGQAQETKETPLPPTWTDELLEECRNIDTRSVNPKKSAYIDSLLQGLNSPAPQSLYVLRRGVHRLKRLLQQRQSCHGDNRSANANNNPSIDHALEMLQMTASFLMKRGYKLVLLSSIFADPKNDGEHNIPNIGDESAIHDEAESDFPFQILRNDRDVSEPKWCEIKTLFSEQETRQPRQPILSCITIANNVLDLVTVASEDQVPLSSSFQDESSVNDLVVAAVDRCLEQLSWTMGMDLRGRTSADAAFIFALVGARNERLFQALASVSSYELLRVGERPSFRSKYVLQIIEKHAAAGSKGPAVDSLYRVAADCLVAKKEHLDLVEGLLLKTSRNDMDKENGEIIAGTNSGEPTFDLLSARPLLWLWRFSARQRKAKNSIPVEYSEVLDTAAAQNTCEENTLSKRVRPAPNLPNFDDPKRPLVVDLGCGMGTSLLGLASATKNDEDYTHNMGKYSFETCNFLGADLSQLALGFGQGVSERWKLADRLQYSWTTAEECLEMVEKSYEGQVGLILIQFPTPYRLESTENQRVGNAQLPSDFQSGFMVSDSLLAQVAQILSRSGGKLLVQSNCEDVAVTIRHRVTTQHGMHCVDVPQEVARMDHVKHQTLRNREWIRMGGERAIGPGWSLTPLLPTRGRTETEVACNDQGTPIHRCLLSF